MLTFFIQSDALASDYKNYKHPVFVGVERVFIHVRYGITEEKIPDVLQRDNVENMLLKLYQDRFSSTDCRKLLNNRNPYSCNDQPVIIISDDDSFELFKGLDTSFFSASDLKDSGTLIVMVTLTSQGNLPFYDPPVEVPVLGYQVVHERPNTSISLNSRVSGIGIIALNQKEEFIKSRLMLGFKHQIK